MHALCLSLLFVTPAAGPPKARPNRLADAASPYLLQHAHNPVDWHPWGPEAFAKARKEEKLVFLSIGYSSCHWCHVMERESFSSPVVAAILNKHFVCIKVDREERPDVDEVYMTALQVAGSSGGWPLSMFLTPSGKPIFGGTYWPPEDREIEGETVPGFKSVLKKVLDLDRDKRKELFAQADQVAEMTTAALERHHSGTPVIELKSDLVTDAAAALELDPEHGGLGSRSRKYQGPKFPRVSALQLLLQVSDRPGFETVKKQLGLTLDRMAAGGIYDHLGGGFHRYSTERTWTVPHFEKMLYDNAQLVELYAEAFAADPKPAYRRVVEETLAFVAREMTSPDGAFYSAIDADSEGEEGRFYVWTPEELAKALGSGEDARLFRTVYGADSPNFEGKYHILRLADPATDAKTLQRLAPLRQKLFEIRSKRERPFLDTKVLTGWNGQMIAAYARAGTVLKVPTYVATAEKAATFLLTTMRTKDHRLYRVYAAPPGGKPEARGPAFLEDYAFLTHGLLALHDATGDVRWLDAARETMDAMIKWYGDPKRGGFYMTAHDGEKLFARGKDYHDGAQPSGNGVAALALVRLHTATGKKQYGDAAEKSIRQFAVPLRTQPESSPLAALALDRYLKVTTKPAPKP